MTDASVSVPMPATSTGILHRRAVQGALMLALIGLAVIWARWMQPRVSLSNGAAWDGGVYVRMAAQSSAGEWALTEVEPYAHRALVPLLVGRIHRHIFPSASLVDIFDAVNTGAGILAAVLLYVWLGSFTASFAHRAIAVVLFLVTWAGPLRYNIWLPTIVDSFWWAVWCGGLVALERVRQKRSLAVTSFCIILGLGILVRETTIWLWVGTLAFATNVRGIGLVVLGGVVAAGAYAVSYLVLDGNSIASIYEQTAALARSRIDEAPSDLMLLAAAVAFGPMLVLPLCDPRGFIVELTRHPYQVPIILCMLFGGSLGLTSQVRHFYWLAPFVYAAMVTALDRWQLLPRRRYLVVGSIVVLQSIAARLWWPIPDEPDGPSAHIVWLTPWTGAGHWEDIDVWWATDVMRHVVGLQYVATFAFLAALLLAGHWWTTRRA